MSLGRPSKYNKGVQKKAENYLLEYETEFDHAIPSITGLARVLKVHRDTLYEWGTKHKIFSDTLADIQAEQEIVLLTRGLRGDFNSNIAKLALANHGFSDKIDQTLSAPGGGPVEISYNGVRSDGRRDSD